MATRDPLIFVCPSCKAQVLVYSKEAEAWCASKHYRPVRMERIEDHEDSSVSSR